MTTGVTVQKVSIGDGFISLKFGQKVGALVGDIRDSVEVFLREQSAEIATKARGLKLSVMDGYYTVSIGVARGSCARPPERNFLRSLWKELLKFLEEYLGITTPSAMPAA